MDSVLLSTVDAIPILLTLFLETALPNVQQATGATLEIIPAIKNVLQDCMDTKVAHKELVTLLSTYQHLLLCFSVTQCQAHSSQSAQKLQSSHTVTETGNYVSRYVLPTCQLHTTEIPLLVSASRFASCLLCIQQILQLAYVHLNASTKHSDIITLRFVWQIVQLAMVILRPVFALIPAASLPKLLAFTIQLLLTECACQSVHSLTTLKI